MAEVRTLLLTDVVDSTRISESIGDVHAAALWAAHDRRARDLLPQWRGREIDKTDGMLLLFEAADDAAGYALAYHAALQRLEPPLVARAGLHVGPVILRDNSAADIALGAKPLEVEGLAKSIAARLCTLASGGQTLLSSAAKETIRDATLRMHSHGHWRLKGVAEPLEIFEVLRDGKPCTPPPDAAKAYRVVREGEQWMPARDIRHTLPAPQDAFVGRGDSLSELARRFDEGARVVSVLGIGGAGKTRLATQFGWSWLGDFPGGAWFCDLTQARGLDGILQSVAAGLDVPLGKEDPVTQLAHAIAGRGECLLILDNFEQVAAHAHETLGRWLARAPLARFLVTTRETLGLRGEQVLSLPPMALVEATLLFTRRAREVNPDFVTAASDARVMRELVELLDGLPLAIELAAARARVMSPRTLLARMSDRFTLLSSGARRDDRQATLRAVLDWSWDLLALPEKAALAQASVFDGGFTLDSFEAVIDLGAYADAPLPMDALQSLAQKSLVRPVDETRFDLLGSVKEYAAQHLRTPGRYEGSGPGAEQAAQIRHGLHFAGLARESGEMPVELANLGAACRRAAGRGDPDVAVRTLESAWAILALQGPYSAGLELAVVVAATANLPTAIRARVDCVAAQALAASGKDVEARTAFQSASERAREGGDRDCECRALIGLAGVDSHAGRLEAARAHFASALALAREVGQQRLQGDALNGFGTLEVFSGREAEARGHYGAALDLARSRGDRRAEGRALSNLGIVHINAGRMDEACVHAEAAIAAAREVGDRRLEANALANLGQIRHLQTRFRDALDPLIAALAVHRELGNRIGETIVLCNLGMAYEALERTDEARDHFERGIEAAREVGDRRGEGQILGYLGVLHAHAGNFDDARRCLEQGKAHLEAISDALSLGILLCGLAEMEQLAGGEDAARNALAAAKSIGDRVGASPDSELGLSIRRAEELVEWKGIEPSTFALRTRRSPS